MAAHRDAGDLIAIPRPIISTACPRFRRRPTDPPPSPYSLHFPPPTRNSKNFRPPGDYFNRTCEQIFANSAGRPRGTALPRGPIHRRSGLPSTLSNDRGAQSHLRLAAIPPARHAHRSAAGDTGGFPGRRSGAAHGSSPGCADPPPAPCKPMCLPHRRPYGWWKSRPIRRSTVTACASIRASRF